MPFIAYPSAFLFPRPEAMSNRSSVEHWPWGFLVRTLGEEQNGFVKVRHRRTDADGTEHDHAWIQRTDLQSNRLLEVNYIDIGQGDGCFVVFPDDQRMLIDAGESDNMYRFLRWRFNRHPTHIHNAVISHPDKDHGKPLWKDVQWEAIHAHPELCPPNPRTPPVGHRRNERAAGTDRASMPSSTNGRHRPPLARS